MNVYTQLLSLHSIIHNQYNAQIYSNIGQIAVKVVEILHVLYRILSLLHIVSSFELQMHHRNVTHYMSLGFNLYILI